MEAIRTIFFSKDRPLQLEAAIMSAGTMGKTNEIINEVSYVLYKASNPEFKKAYEILEKRYPFVLFVEEENFKKDLLESLQYGRFVIFVTDDTIFFRPYSPAKIAEALSTNHRLLGFSLRLGQNTTHCYPYNRPNDKPNFIYSMDEDYLVYDWTRVGFGDFAYPLEVSSSMYEVSKIIALLEYGDYKNPNELEYFMSINAGLYKTHWSLLACYPTSVAFSNPINKVQTTNNNRAESDPKNAPEALLEHFNQGKVIYLEDFTRGFIPNGCHHAKDINVFKFWASIEEREKKEKDEYRL